MKLKIYHIPYVYALYLKRASEQGVEFDLSSYKDVKFDLSKTPEGKDFWEKTLNLDLFDFVNLYGLRLNYIDLFGGESTGQLYSGRRSMYFSWDNTSYECGEVLRKQEIYNNDLKLLLDEVMLEFEKMIERGSSFYETFNVKKIDVRSSPNLWRYYRGDADELAYLSYYYYFDDNARRLVDSTFDPDNPQYGLITPSTIKITEYLKMSEWYNKVRYYHHSPDPRNMNKGYMLSDYSVGIEVEKDHFVLSDRIKGGTLTPMKRGDYIPKPIPLLFKGVETDSSCGLEAITHILPLSNKRDVKKLVFNLFDDAKEYIDSPTNERCGGHMTVSRKGMKSLELAKKFKSGLAFIYSMYKPRLKSKYCYFDKRANRYSDNHYTPVKIIDDIMEIRLFAKIRSVSQLKKRYMLLYKLLYYSVDLGYSVEEIYPKIKTLLLRMYGGDEKKVDGVYKYAILFEDYLVNGNIDPKIEEFVEVKRWDNWDDIPVVSMLETEIDI